LPVVAATTHPGSTASAPARDEAPPRRPLDHTDYRRRTGPRPRRPAVRSACIPRSSSGVQRRCDGGRPVLRGGRHRQRPPGRHLGAYYAIIGPAHRASVIARFRTLADDDLYAEDDLDGDPPPF
jgi:hypothetical protein